MGSMREGEAQETAQELEEKNAIRDELIKGMETGSLSSYQKVASKVNQPVARADKEICTGCSTHIPAQLYNEVLKGEKIRQCPNCLRILIHPEANRGPDEQEQ